jgi:hypothetical protein
MKLSIFLKPSKLYLPTFFGWCILFFCLSILSIMAMYFVLPFLSLTKPVHSEYIIVEGWIPDYCMKEVQKIYNSQSVKKIFITGGPIEQGTYLIEYKNFATLGANTLKKLGIPDSSLIAIPTPIVQRDRTYKSVVTLKQWLDIHNFNLSSVTIITLGAHSRRSFILFNKVFGKTCKIGILSIPDQNYNQNKWFLSSAGFKIVTMEFVSYIYTKIILLFTII